MDYHYTNKKLRRTFMFTLIPFGTKKRLILGWRKYGPPGNFAFRGVHFIKRSKMWKK